MKKVYYVILIFILLYSFLIFLWVLYPASIFGLKYNVTSRLKFKDLNKGPYLFIVDHRDPPHTDIMIMSQEVHNSKNPEKFTLLSGRSERFYTNFLYYTKYNIIEKKSNTTQKCIDKLKNNENVVIFLRDDSKGKGIYYILKETNIPIIFVKKKLIKNSTNKKLENHIFKYRGMEYNIDYNLISEYDIKNKNSEEFMNWIKKNLYSY